MAQGNSKLLEIGLKKWQQCVEKINQEKTRLDVSEHRYSEDFDYLCKAIFDSPINKDEIKKRIDLLIDRKRDLSSDSFKTSLGDFISYCNKLVYEYPEESRQILKKLGYTAPKREQYSPQPTSRPIPRPERPYQFDFPKPRPYEFDFPKPRKRSIFRIVLDWIDDKLDTIKMWIDIIIKYLDDYQIGAIIIGIIGLLLFIIKIVEAFSGGHTFTGIVMILFSGVFIYILYYAATIINYILVFINYILKGILYRWWTVLLTICIIASYTPIKNYFNSISEHPLQIEKKVTTPYICTASSLNVRSYASTKSACIGKIKKGEVVNVYCIEKGFAKIDYKGSIGYVSAKYIKPNN